MAQQTTPAFGGQYARRIKVYGVSPRELQQVANSGGYLVWTFFGMAVGAALTALGTLLSGSSFDQVTLLVLTALTISGAFLAVLTLILAIREQVRVRSVLREIRRDPERLLADVGVVMQLAEPPAAAPPARPGSAQGSSPPTAAPAPAAGSTAPADSPAPPHGPAPAAAPPGGAGNGDQTASGRRRAGPPA